MHSTLVRAQTVFGYFTTIVGVVAALIALSDFATPRTPSATLSVGKINVVKGRPHYYSSKKEEYAKISFNLDADLSTLFNWNTKQVFVYVIASWPTNGTASTAEDVEAGGAGHMNEAVIWDTIITAPTSDHLSNVGPIARKKLAKSAKGKSIDPSRGILKLKNQKSKYQITAPSGKLANTKDMKLELHYNVQPWVGVLTWRPKINLGMWKLLTGGESRLFTLPAIKEKA